jgi:hypothetical protein
MFVIRVSIQKPSVSHQTGVCKHGKTKYPIQIWKVGVKEWIKGKPGHPRLLREDEAGSV